MIIMLFPQSQVIALCLPHIFKYSTLSTKLQLQFLFPLLCFFLGTFPNTLIVLTHENLSVNISLEMRLPYSFEHMHKALAKFLFTVHKLYSFPHSS